MGAEISFVPYRKDSGNAWTFVSYSGDPEAACYEKLTNGPQYFSYDADVIAGSPQFVEKHPQT
jgi:hypothetical protein